MKTIAFIGAGNIGGRMAKRVLKAGYPLVVCDTSPAVRDRFSRLGACTTESPGDCAAADLVIVLVATGEQMRDALLGPGGMLERVDPARPPIVAIMSTVLPRMAEAVRGPLEQKGVRVVDAPVSGGLVSAEEGTLSIMIGGEEAVIDAILPVLEAMGRKIFRCGTFGSGELTKIINNMIGITNLYLGAEAFQLALRHGLDLERLAAVLEESTGRNFFSKDGSTIAPQYAAWAETPAAFGALADIVRKDLGLARSLTEDARLRLPVLDGIAESLGDLGDEAFRRWREIAAARTDSAGLEAGRPSARDQR